METHALRDPGMGPALLTADAGEGAEAPARPTGLWTTVPPHRSRWVTYTEQLWHQVKQRPPPRNVHVAGLSGPCSTGPPPQQEGPAIVGTRQLGQPRSGTLTDHLGGWRTGSPDPSCGAGLPATRASPIGPHAALPLVTGLREQVSEAHRPAGAARERAGSQRAPRAEALPEGRSAPGRTDKRLSAHARASAHGRGRDGRRAGNERCWRLAPPKKRRSPGQKRGIPGWGLGSPGWEVGSTG